ncbi:LysR family transcriptional regulator [Paraburkholderia pallida]|uniref:LysR family transcriptional regulator n=1 Tax=Paraburkholderia pallida TaxID=2547399 RepID=A0A4P7DB23_9BURK|nr:LysR family transcriptional regulator [Paraburkholderia pallida]QBR04144.1 LysR family transcriptional regulator [Paraburkholderia pallida]
MNDRFFSLQLFARVARSGSFSVAGREMGISQPTASRIVAALEKQVGVALFVRTTRAVTLTEAGSEYLSRIEPILVALEEADHAARGTGELRGILRVATSSGFAIRGVLPRLARFADQHSALRIEFVLNDDRQDLVGESVDVALRVGVLEDSTAIARKIGTVHRVVVAAPAYLARAGTPAAPLDLAGHTIIVGPAGRGMEGWTFWRDGKEDSVRVEGRFILNGTDAAVAAAVAGLGILSTADFSVMNELRTGQLARLLPDWEMGSADMNVVLPAGRAAKPSARAFSDFMATEFRDLEAARNEGKRIAR